MSDFTSAYHYIKNQYYIPDDYRLEKKEVEEKLGELLQLYKPYLYDGVGNPPKAKHPSEEHKEYKADKLPVDRYFIYKDGKLKSIKVKPRSIKSFLKTDRYNMVETRHLSKNTYSFMKKMTDGVVHPYLLEDLERDILDDGQQIDMFDIGGCGCFVTYD